MVPGILLESSTIALPLWVGEGSHVCLRTMLGQGWETGNGQFACDVRCWTLQPLPVWCQCTKVEAGSSLCMRHVLKDASAASV